jgi:hypothetical protein
MLIALIVLVGFVAAGEQPRATGGQESDRCVRLQARRGEKRLLMQQR